MLPTMLPSKTELNEHLLTYFETFRNNNSKCVDLSY